jgi:surfeit locus 1 family protein
MARYRFQPRVLPTLLALGGAVLTAWLGDWQLNRAAYKAELQQRLDLAAHQPPVRLTAEPVASADLAFYRVQATGEFLTDATILLDNRVRQGQVGYEVVTPLKLPGGAVAVLVNRGWVKAPPTREERPEVRTPSGTIMLEGIALPPPGPAFRLSAPPEAGAVWQHLSLERAQARVGLPLQPVVLQQSNDTGDGLARDWPRPQTGINTHRAYALQWFTMCGVILLLYVVLNVRKQPQPLSPA